MDLVINYAAVGFRPYEEIGEYLNIGVVAVEARSRYLAFRLLPVQRTKRVRACFPEFDLRLYRRGLQRIEREFSALAIETNHWDDDLRAGARNNPAQLDLFAEAGNTGMFRELTRPSGGPFFFAARGTRLVADVDEAVEELYRRYVEHWHLTPLDYEEKRLTRDIRRLLEANKLDRYYREAPYVGTEVYHVGVPLAFQPDGHEVPVKAMKPLNLAQTTPTRIYMHGDEWIARVNRLRSLDRLPGEFLFVVRKPVDPDGRRAADEICDGLVQTGCLVADVDDEEAILTFARIEEPDDFALEGE